MPLGHTRPALPACRLCPHKNRAANDSRQERQCEKVEKKKSAPAWYAASTMGRRQTSVRGRPKGCHGILGKQCFPPRSFCQANPPPKHATFYIGAKKKAQEASRIVYIFCEESPLTQSFSPQPTMISPKPAASKENGGLVRAPKS